MTIFEFIFDAVNHAIDVMKDMTFLMGISLWQLILFSIYAVDIEIIIKTIFGKGAEKK
jgi:hypothetical protein